MPERRLVGLDMQGLSILDAIIENGAIKEASTLPKGKKGLLVFYENEVKYYNGTKWIGQSELVTAGLSITNVGNGKVTINGTEYTIYTLPTITNKMQATMPPNTLKGNNTSASANADDLEISEVLAMLGIDLEKLNSKVSDVKVDGEKVVVDGVALIDLRTPINQALNSLKVGLPNGVATLDSSGKVPQSQLPSYVDDVLEYESKSLFPTTGEAGKIYIDASTNKSYRWSGTIYIEISSSLAIGTINGTAADGGVAQSHYNDNTRHITATERIEWNAKQNTQEELLISREVNTNSQPPFSASKKSIYEWLTSLWEYAYIVSERLRYVENLYSNKYVSDSLIGDTGTILASTHKCGKTPQVQAWLNGAFVLCEISVNTSGDVTWKSNEAFTSSSNFKLIIQG